MYMYSYMHPSISWVHYPTNIGKQNHQHQLKSISHQEQCIWFKTLQLLKKSNLYVVLSMGVEMYIYIYIYTSVFIYISLFHFHHCLCQLVPVSTKWYMKWQQRMPSTQIWTFVLSTMWSAWHPAEKRYRPHGHRLTHTEAVQGLGQGRHQESGSPSSSSGRYSEEKTRDGMVAS